MGDLVLLNDTRREMGAEAERKVLEKFIVSPVSRLEKALSWLLKRLGF